DGLVGRRRATVSPATSTVVDVGVEIGAMTAATTLTCGAADVASAGPADATGVAAARLAGRQTLGLLLRIATLAEGLARVRPLRPRGLKPERAQDSAGEYGPQPAQRFAARHRFGQRFREFVEQVFHDWFPFSNRKAGLVLARTIQTSDYH